MIEFKRRYEISRFSFDFRFNIFPNTMALFRSLFFRKSRNNVAVSFEETVPAKKIIETTDTSTLGVYYPKKLDTVASWILIVGIFLLPLFFLPFSNIIIESGKTLFLVGMVTLSFLAWLIGRLKTGVFIIPKHFLLVSGLLLVAVFFSSALASPSFTASFSGFAYEAGTVVSIGALFLLMFLVAALFRTPKQVIYLYGALTASLVILFVFHLVRLILGVDYFSFGVFTNTVASLVGKWNDLGSFAGLMVLLSFLSVEFAPLSRLLKVVLYLVLGFSLLLLVLVNFFLGWIVVGAMALIVLVYNLTLYRPSEDSVLGGNERRFSVGSICILLLAVLFLVSGDSIGATLSESTGINYIEVRPSWGATLSVVEETWKENVLLGSGPNRFTTAWLKFKPEAVNETLFWNNDFATGIGLAPTFAVTTGVLGTLALLLFLGTFLYSGFRALFTAGDLFARFLILSSFIGGFYLWVIVIFYVPNIVLLSLAFVFTGVFISLLAHYGLIKTIFIFVTRDPRIGFLSVLLLLLLSVGTVLGGYTIFERYLSLAFVHQGRTALAQYGDFDRAEGLINRAIALNNSDILYRQLADVELIRLGSILNREGASIEAIRTEFQDTLGKAIAAGQGAIQIDETNYLNWDSLGKVYSAVIPLNIPGAYESAKASLDRAIALSPQSPALVLSQARIELSRGNAKEARNYITSALALKSNYADALFLLAQIEINEGNTFGAIRSLEQAALLSPNDIGLFFRLGILNYSVGANQKAIDALERAIVLSPSYANAKYFLGLAYANIRRNDEAVKQFEDILVTNPGNEEVEKILENLKNGVSPLTGIESLSSTERDGAPIGEGEFIDSN